MMETGIFAKTYQRDSLQAVLDAVAADGFRQIQFNFQSTGQESMPRHIDPHAIEAIGEACAQRSIWITAISGTFNLIHPDPAQRTDGLTRWAVLAAAADRLGVGLITLCTGTRDPVDMWHHHPDNIRDDAWQDLLRSLAIAIELADRHSLLLGIEPEPGNVIANAKLARKLLDEMQSDHIGIVFDPANLIAGVPTAEVETFLMAALGLLGDQVISVHGKDRAADGSFVPAGSGIVPWETMLVDLSNRGYTSPILIHGLSEAEAPVAKSHLDHVIASLSP